MEWILSITIYLYAVPFPVKSHAWKENEKKKKKSINITHKPNADIPFFRQSQQLPAVALSQRTWEASSRCRPGRCPP